MILWQLAVILINVAIAVFALVVLRYGMSMLVGVNMKDELDKKDNFAFGITVAGAALSLILIMASAISGEASASLLQETLNASMYALLGIVLLKIGFVIQDNLLLRKISFTEEIKNGNVSASVVAAANLVAVGLIIQTSIYWVDDEGIGGLIPVILVYIASQIILALATLIRIKVFAKRNADDTWQGAINKNNLAVALRYAGQILATALAISSISHLVNYDTTLLVEVVLVWFAFGVAAMIGVWVLYRITLPIVLSKIDIAEEVDKQGNVGVASIEAALFIGIASLFMGFLA